MVWVMSSYITTLQVCPEHNKCINLPLWYKVAASTVQTCQCSRTSNTMLVYRPACENDMFDILKLYTEFNQSEPFAQALGVSSYINPNIAQSLTMLAQSGNIMLCCEGHSQAVLGMGVFYNKQCEDWPAEEIESFCTLHGFPELCPTITLSSSVLESERIGKTQWVDTITYLEMLVTTNMARGKGVASGIVQAVEGEVEGVMASVASSEGTDRILRRRGWKAWNTLDCSQFEFRNERPFKGVRPVTVFVKDQRKCNQ
jgi:hypothetical protein